MGLEPVCRLSRLVIGHTFEVHSLPRKSRGRKVSKFNQAGTRTAVSGPIKTTGVAGTTYEGATGYGRDAKSELFLLAVANMVGESTFYEKADDRDKRFRELVVAVANEDPEWVEAFLPWLRKEGNMRSAPLVAAAELVRAKPAGMRTRKVVDSVLQRADEPSEILAYWLSTYGKTIPIALKRGVADAVVRLYSERSFAKYDSAERAVRMGDVIDLVTPAYHHPKVRGTWRYSLYGHAIDRRHKRDKPIPEDLPLLRARQELLTLPVAQRRAVLLEDDGPARLAAAGMTWEALAGWLQGPMDAKAWEAILPSMGIMALSRNLRNFDEAGVSDAAAAQVIAKFTDAEEVARSRMFPFRWWAAYKAAPSLRWGHALEQALGHSLANVPALKGRTLILVDRSPSMFPGYFFSTPNKSDISLAEQAAVFGAALARRAEAPTLVEFGGQSRETQVPKGGSVLKLIETFGQIDGTDIPSAVKAHFAGHDRVVIVTDEQTRPGWLPSNMWQGHGGMRETQIDDLVPKNVPVYMWNMSGYKAGAMPTGTGTRHCFGGLTDHAFRLIPLLERGRDAAWPWLNQQTAP